MLLTYQLFGGDAAQQKAEMFAREHGWIVHELDTPDAPFARYGLDPWGRGWGGYIYSYVAQPAE
jgi:hypothetical protein